MKIRPVGAELFHADRRTDMTKIMVAFRNFVKAPNKHVPVLAFCLLRLPSAGANELQNIGSNLKDLKCFDPSSFFFLSYGIQHLQSLHSSSV